jgi:hypothetical protein
MSACFRRLYCSARAIQRQYRIRTALIVLSALSRNDVDFGSGDVCSCAPIPSTLVLGQHYWDNSPTRLIQPMLFAITFDAAVLGIDFTAVKSDIVSFQHVFLLIIRE